MELSEKLEVSCKLADKFRKVTFCKVAVSEIAPGCLVDIEV